ncbi:hypothetical protein SETIT_9G496400v2 [Setaria italica]|uniref:Xylanase inhibitor C-terminal domain-containing protein n=1 Tax=Setaria italica TaxID=4555 RepID=K4ACG9_SETIT|nr:hypothetical protein SETIT_9G496400v2 [Setaria italica]
MGVSSRTQLLLLLAISSVLAFNHAAAAGAVIEVRRKLPLHCGGGGCHYAEHLEHDARRQGRRLSPGTNFPLGGSPATETGLYFAELTIGKPPKAYGMEVDTGSGSALVNCVTRDSCPREDISGQLGKQASDFALCLDTSYGAGVVATGNIVCPAILKTSLVSNRLHYVVNMKSVSVAGTTLDLPRNTYYGEGKSVAIDIGTTLTYLPEKVYNAMMIEIFDKHQGTLFYDIQNLLYIKHYGRVDDVFPEITLHFEGGLALNIYPHDYLLNNGSDWYFVGLRNGRSQPVNLRDMVILGGSALFVTISFLVCSISIFLNLMTLNLLFRYGLFK